MKNQKVSCSCPRNYILLGNDIDGLKNRARTIAEEARQLCPAAFNGDTPYIEYEMRYVPPFEKNFDMLFNIQGIAADKTRFQDNYRGFFIFDVSKYLRHEKEDWFDITLKFIHDQNDIWQYVFLVDMKNIRTGEEMAAKILSLLYCQVEDTRESVVIEAKRFIERECKSNAMMLTKAAQLFLEDYLSKKDGSRDVVSTFLTELSSKYGNATKIDMKMINEQIETGTSVIRYMLSPDKYSRFLELTETYVMKGLDYDEKI